MKTKRFPAILLILFLTISLFSCANTKEDDGKLSIVTTNFALYDFARAVCGESCNVEMLISPGSESHDFEATLADMAKIADADLFVYIGGESEEWVDSAFESMGKTADKIRKIRAMDLVELYHEEEFPDHDHDHDHNESLLYDEHVWTSIPNAITIMERIADEIDRLDSSLESVLNVNLNSYRNELELIHEEFDSLAKGTSNKTIVVADRFPFRYMAEEYGLQYYAAFSGCSSDTEPTLSTVNFLVEKVKEDNIPIIFIIEFSDGATARAVAAETGAEILTLHSAHNVTKADFESGITYVDIMRSNLDALKQALK